METDSQKPRLREPLSRFVSAPVDIASLAAFRILFGLLMAGAMVRFICKGWVSLLYVDPKFFFYYPGFEWIRPWPGVWMHVHFVLLAVVAGCVALGIFYRLAIVLFFLGFTYVELIDQTAYLNHYYLISLLSGLMIFLPANRAWSLDAWRRPESRADAIPAWCLNLLRFQIAVVYIFAGLAKFNSDWLLHAEPLRMWLSARADLPLIGPWLSEVWVAYAASWFGAFFDTGIVFFLLWRPTRKAAYVLVVLFHVATWMLFNIGMFPWIMIVAATLFFPPDWPRQVLAAVGRLLKTSGFRGCITAASAIGGPPRRLAWGASACVVPLLAAYIAVQLALPLRSYFCSEPPAWTCAGFNCAWRVMIAEKTGYAEFYAVDPTSGVRWKLSVKDYLTSRQETLMAQDPYLVREMARRLAADLNTRGRTNLQVHVNAFATLNGRPSQFLVRPEIDLAAAATQPSWILPLKE